MFLCHLVALCHNVVNVLSLLLLLFLLLDEVQIRRGGGKVSLLHIFYGNWTLCFITKSDPSGHSVPLKSCCCKTDTKRQEKEEEAKSVLIDCGMSAADTPLVYCPSSSRSSNRDHSYIPRPNHLVSSSFTLLPPTRPSRGIGGGGVSVGGVLSRIE